MTPLESSPESATGPARPLRERILDAATARLVESGWQALRISSLARDVGVSRQTIYNEFGGKAEMAEALVLRELVDVMAAATAEIPGPLGIHEGLHRSVLAALRRSQQVPITHAITAALQEGGGGQLIALLTTRSSIVIAMGTDLLMQALESDPLLTMMSREHARLGMETAVRLVVSHLLEGSVDPERSARDIMRVVGAYLDPASAAESMG